MSWLTTMKTIPRWWPPEIIVHLMVFCGMAMVFFAIPIGIQMGWMAYQEPYADLKSAVVFGVVMTFICFVLGIIFLRVFGWFSKRYHAMTLALVRSTTRELINDLVEENYESILRRCYKSHSSIDGLRAVMHGHEPSLVKLNAGVYEQIEVQRIIAKGMAKWSVRAFLWTENERKVDLTLHLTIAADAKEPLIKAAVISGSPWVAGFRRSSATMISGVLCAEAGFRGRSW